MAPKANTLTLEEIDEQNYSDTKNRMIRFLWIGLVVILAALAGYQLMQHDILPIQEIKIVSEFKQLQYEELQSIVNRGVQGNIFTVDVEGLYHQLLALPWVEKVWIHRIWPNIIKVNLQEQKPVAILRGRGLLNQYGEVFCKNTNYKDKKLPLFIVAKDHILESVGQYQKNVKILIKNGFDASVFYYDERKSQKIKLTNGMELVLGRVDVERRLEKFLKAYMAYLRQDKRQIKRVDLRYTNGFAIRWATPLT